MLWFPLNGEKEEISVKWPELNEALMYYFVDALRSKLVENPNTGIWDYLFTGLSFSGMKLTFSGAFFNSDDFLMNIKEIEIFVSELFGKFPNEFLSEGVSLSRLDVACNIPFFLNTHNGKIHKRNKNASIRKFYWGTEKKQNFTGFSIGKRGDEFVYFSAYDKRYSPNRKKNLNRHKTYNYTRIEYQIGHRRLKKEYELRSYNNLINLNKNQIEKFVAKLQDLANVTFEDEKDLTYSLKDYINAKGQPIEDNNAEQIYVMDNAQ
jgi:signal peptidase I